MSRQRGIYEMRDADGKVVSRGPAKELAEKYYFSVNTLYTDVKRGDLLDRQYRVFRVGSEEMVDEINEQIIGYWNSGLTYQEIADRLSMPVQRIRTRVWSMRKRGMIA